MPAIHRRLAGVQRNVLVVLCLIAGAALAWWAATSSGPQPSAATGADQPSEPLPVAPPASTRARTPTAAEPERAPAAPSAPSPNTNAQAEPAHAAAIPPPARSGPVDEWKQLYATEPRASGVASLEAAIQEQFHRPEVPPGLLKSALCRTTVCRVETRWTPERAEGFMSAFMHLIAVPDGGQGRFTQLAISPEGNADGTYAIDVYVRIPSEPR